VSLAGKTRLSNQSRRTRKDLLEATARLLKQGRKPNLEEVAEEALVSRATAYRYFPSMEALLREAPLDVAAPDPEDIFAGESPDDPVLRLERAEAALYKMIIENEVQLRMMLAHSLEERAKNSHGSQLPVRQNRRTLLIEAALAPARKQFRTADLENLTKALALIIGTEAMVVFRDVLNLDDSEANGVKRWAIRALVAAAKRPHSA
jgi:AcrR family transcriptional regulator